MIAVDMAILRPDDPEEPTVVIQDSGSEPRPAKSENCGVSQEVPEKIQAYEVKCRNLVALMRAKKKAGTMWFDTGCRRNVSGPDDHARMQEYLKSFGLQPVKRLKKEEFIFGDGKIDTSEHSWEYPAFLGGKYVGEIRIAECHVPCPPLFSLEMAEQWEAVTNHKKKTLTLERHNVTIPFNKGTPYLDVLDCGDEPDLGNVPDKFFP